MQPEDPNEIVRFMTAPNPFEAHIWEQALQREGIQCQVVGDFLAGGLGDVPGILPELWVRQGDTARAQQIIEEASANAGQAEG